MIGQQEPLRGTIRSVQRELSRASSGTGRELGTGYLYLGPVAGGTGQPVTVFPASVERASTFAQFVDWLYLEPPPGRTDECRERYGCDQRDGCGDHARDLPTAHLPDGDEVADQ